MAESEFNQRQRDLITEGGLRFRRQIDRLGRYLAGQTWEVTSRSTSAISAVDPLLNHHHTRRSGSVSFSQLSNGNLKAELTWIHAVDDDPISASYLIVLDPFNKTFTGIGITDKISQGAIVSGSIERARDRLNWSDISPGLGSGEGLTLVRTWGFTPS